MICLKLQLADLDNSMTPTEPLADARGSVKIFRNDVLISTHQKAHAKVNQEIIFPAHQRINISRFSA